MGQSAELIAAKRCLHVILKCFDYEKKELHSTRLKELKTLVRNHSDIIVGLVEYLLKIVRQENSDRRLAILLICECFFQRSHAFRVELTKSLQDFLIYTAETDPLHYPLPAPKEASNALKIETLKLVKKWHQKFAFAYPKLNHTVQFLRSSKSFNFEEADAQLEAERVRAEEAQQRLEARGRRCLELVTNQMNEKHDDIERCIHEARNALELLVPKFVDPNDSVADCPSESSVPTTNVSSLRKDAEQEVLHAYTDIDTISVVIPSKLPSIKRTDANEPIIGTLVDTLKLLRFYEKFIAKALKKLVSFGGRYMEKTIKELVELKGRVTLEIERCDELKVEGLAKKLDASESDSDSEFEDVPEKEGLELDFKPPDEVPDYILSRIKEIDQEAGPSTSGINSRLKKSSEAQEGLSTGKSDDKPKIPTLSFGLDLKYWGEKDIKPAEIPRNNSDCHRFWRPADDDSTAVVSDDLEVYQTRLITFAGKEERSKRQCRAPLSDGSLCPRMDKHKCPIHGVIIDRDSMGFPTREQAQQASSKQTQPKEDEEYMRDLEAATGVDCRLENMRKGKRRVTKRREVPASQQVRQRLEKKLLDRRTVKRVSATLDAIRKQRNAQRFQHQFNYALFER